MAYWCDDEALNFEQRRLDVEQQDALAQAKERGRSWAQRITKQMEFAEIRHWSLGSDAGPVRGLNRPARTVAPP